MGVEPRLAPFVRQADLCGLAGQAHAETSVGRLRAQSRRYLKSFSSVYDVAGHAFELRRGRVILSGVHDAPEAVSLT
jgi:hypothetical protein